MNTETEMPLALIDEFIAEHGLTMRVTRTDRNPHMDDSRNMRHFLCTIMGKGNAMTLTFSQGSAHTKPPTLADVLDCLASDATSVENAEGFENWADELGYSADSRKAEATYDACEMQSAELKDLLGEEAFEALLYKVERL